MLKMATEELITMSQQEVSRLQVLEKLESGAPRQNEAGKILKISSRQIRRLLKSYRQQGAKAWCQKNAAGQAITGLVKK